MRYQRDFFLASLGYHFDIFVPTGLFCRRRHTSVVSSESQSRPVCLFPFVLVGVIVFVPWKCSCRPCGLLLVWWGGVMLSPDWALPIDGAALFSWSLPPPLESAAVGPRYRRLIIMAGRDRRLRDGFAVGGILFVCVCECCCCCCPVCCVAALSPACVPVCCRVYREYTALSSYRPVFPRSVSRRIVTFGGSSGKFPR